MAYITDSFDEEITRLLNSGGVGVVPTDTIYGLSARALDKPAVERLHILKQRDGGKPFIILISKIEQLQTLGISLHLAKAVSPYWPGSLSVIFEAEAPSWLQRGTKTLAVRLPGYQPVLNLINQIGPLVSTSANTEGQAPANNIKQAREYFGESADFYVDAGELKADPSTIAKISDGKLEVIRQGAVKLS